MNKPFRFPKLLVALMALTVIVLHSAALAEGVQAVVSVESMNVYAESAPHALLGALPRGTEVEVTAKSGKAVMIRYSGYTGIARASDLKKAETAQAETDTGRAMVANRDSRIYSRASTSSSYAAIGAGESVTLLGVNGQCAKVKRDGRVGYMVAGHLSEPGAAAPQQDTSPAEPVTTVNTAAVTNQDAKVYASAALSGESVRVSKGVGLTLLAVRGDVAMVERGGAIGFMRLSALSKGSAAESAPKARNPFSSGSNEHTIYAFLTDEMNLNRAAAMGVMANIKYESGYNPNCNGDGGTSYGICQWHAGRKTNLIAYCEEQGLDYTTLEGQLRYFRYELSGRYPSVLSYLKGVENTADGAYDAGYYFCFNYEAPAARTSQSTKRGNYAKDTLWAK